MAKIAQLIEGNYNKLDNIPVINQDLTASGFTPVANTYYRHTGATNGTFMQGVIYFYDTAYHKLGESGGGGTTLNRYELSMSVSQLKSSTRLLFDIYTQAKGRVVACQYADISNEHYYYNEYSLNQILYQYTSSDTVKTIDLSRIQGQNPGVYIEARSANAQGDKVNYGVIGSDKTITGAGSYEWTDSTIVKIIYFNDTEITA